MSKFPDSVGAERSIARRKFIKLASLAGSSIAAGSLLSGCSSAAQAVARLPAKTTGDVLPSLPPLAPIPDLPPKQPIGSVTMGDPATFAEVKMDFPIVQGRMRRLGNPSRRIIPARK
jgi:hypothetical protein